MNPLPSGERILIVAPTGADAVNLRSILSQAGFEPQPLPDVATLAREIEQECGAILLTEEALTCAPQRTLADALDRQPAWSDLPLILIVTGGNTPSASAEALRHFGARGNVTLVERPLRRATLLSTLRAALCARHRQYEVKNLLRERDELLASLERRVAERTAKLEELNAELEAFSYSVSHDLRAPLRALEMYARVLCEDFKDLLPEEGQHCAERIAKNAGRMDRLTRDVLTLSRLTRSEMHMSPLDLDTVLSDIIEQYPDLAAASRFIELRTPLGCVLGHAPSLTQCFSNLLQNALKFVPPERAPAVVVSSQAEADRVRVFVEDNGVGIDPRHHERIFGIFERASPASVPGTGIGLAIARKAIERMGGSIGVSSARDTGARFWIELPRAMTA